MVVVTLATSLVTYLNDADEGAASPTDSRSITVTADSWLGLVQEISLRFDRLAKHLFDEDGRLRRGFLLAVNDEIYRRPDRLACLRNGDQLFVFTQIAGG
ncbi:MoaD/ThiS family protein [Nocardia blacklockiae]|uniref:MoaD/ThiS family protein n=1 Tax=Nocardia blacklockiae TaxID=480036 RepID=UPI001893590F|nr:MoaD/ThiS family protein [Nocardia blacklockiae]MBF6170090.1 MoaD/ThiS family protein [Nocardia blacklockiae]